LFLDIYFVFEPWILSSTYCSLLSGFQLLFIFDLRKFLFPGFLFNSFVLRFSISLLNSSSLISSSVFFISYISLL
jgi:hypothetical protein